MEKQLSLQERINKTFLSCSKGILNDFKKDFYENIINENIDVNVSCFENGKLFLNANLPHTLLHYASLYDHPDLIQFLLDNGADIEAKDGEGDTPLCWAAFKNKYSSVKCLLENGACLTFSDDNNLSPLDFMNDNLEKLSIKHFKKESIHYLAFNKESKSLEKALKKLKKKYPDEYDYKNANEWTIKSNKLALTNIAKFPHNPLQYASMVKDNDECIDMLISYNKDLIKMEDFEADTALEWACYLNNISAVKLLLKYNADPLRIDNNKFTCRDMTVDVKIKQYITNWINSTDDDFSTWFIENDLIEYKSIFQEEGFDDLEILSQLNIDDLNEINITNKSVQNKILIACKLINDDGNEDGDTSNNDNDNDIPPPLPKRDY
eukprot:TRINITY_DN3077_c5_g1_i1.p1 TRINITY_DN3077_c5_g1~~TRINITY_DN3077_c5_g1_i1.p1  ORF type:complete len:379 (-),score=108.91 TRINITY_DN3077_c5_g1_i1:72-1208(-)